MQFLFLLMCFMISIVYTVIVLQLLAGLIGMQSSVYKKSHNVFFF